jgi:hypothetical protein
LELSEEEKKELSIGLLREWWLEATQTLVDLVGSEESFRLLRPYFYHAGMAGRRVYDGIVKLDLDGGDSMRVHGYLLAEALGGTYRPAYMAEDKSGIGEFTGCTTNGRSEAVCALICEVAPLSYLQEKNPDWEIHLISSLCWGNETCQWKVLRSGSSALVEAKEEAMKSLFHRLQLLGSSIGLQIKRGTSDGSSIKTINRTVQLISDLHRRTSQMNINGNLIECTISDCPFAGTGVMDICLQYQAFFNGICEAIDPCYEFAYDRLMTKGDKTCHWTIRKKGAAKEKPQGEAAKEPGETAFELLKKRLVKGEITPEQYRQLRDIMLEK